MGGRGEMCELELNVVKRIFCLGTQLGVGGSRLAACIARLDIMLRELAFNLASDPALISPVCILTALLTHFETGQTRGSHK